MPIRKRTEQEVVDLRGEKLASKLSWELDLLDPMIINIVYAEGDNDCVVMQIFIGEAIDCAGREPIMEHLSEIESSPWLVNWHKLEKENEHSRAK